MYAGRRPTQPRGYMGPARATGYVPRGPLPAPTPYARGPPPQPQQQRRPAPYPVRSIPPRGPGQRFPVPNVQSGRTQYDSYFPFHQVERKLPELCKRYPKLHYSQDLTQSVAHWVGGQQKLYESINFSRAVDFTFESEESVPAAGEDNDTESEHDTHSVRVLLLSPAAPPVPDEGKPPTLPPHLLQRLKFVVGVNAKGAVVPYGGAWRPSDGADPTKEATLVNTAIRAVQETAGIDLSPCKTWTKFLEVQYRRKSGAVHRSTLLLPHTWSAFEGQTLTVLKAASKEQKEVEIDEEVDDFEGGVAKKKTIKKKVVQEVDKVALKPAEYTLASLLELSTFDAGESTVEAALFAHSFDEFLSYQKTRSLLTLLRQKKKEADEQASVLKRKREEEAAERTATLEKHKEEAEAKRQKLEEEKKAQEEAKKKEEEEEKDLPEEERNQRKQEREAKAAEERKAKEEELKAQREAIIKQREEELKQKKEEEEAKKKAQEEEDRKRGYRISVQTLTHVNEEQAEPFQYFDRPNGTSGQLRREQLEGILHALGELTQREVDGLLRAVGLTAERINTPLFYRRLASFTTTEEKHIPLPDQPEGQPQAEPMVEDTPATAAPAE